MATAVKVPDMGTTVEEVTLLRWLKQEGDFVRRGEALCEIETDKAAVELESHAEGVLLKRLFGDNAKLAVGTVIAYLGEAGEKIA
jgi:pyruvate/2-oxoglutarate dehydrogenase complex dihydrolipoamide acyltransferase (E2) component